MSTDLNTAGSVHANADFKVIPKLPIQTLWLSPCLQGTRMHLMPNARLADNLELLIELPIQTLWISPCLQGTHMHLMPNASSRVIQSFIYKHFHSRTGPKLMHIKYTSQQASFRENGKVTRF